MSRVRLLALASGLLLAAAAAAGDGPEVAPPPRPVAVKPARKGGRPGEVITPAAKGERITADKLKVGDKAPDFTLKSVDGKQKVTLSDFRGQKPVVLIFASYT